MPRIKWNRILAVLLAIVLISRWRTVMELVGQMQLRAFWNDFCATASAIPPLGKYTIILSLMALLYVSLFKLILNRRKDRQ